MLLWLEGLVLLVAVERLVAVVLAERLVGEVLENAHICLCMGFERGKTGRGEAIMLRSWLMGRAGEVVDMVAVVSLR